MLNQTIQVTNVGFEALKKELDNLVNVKRPQIVDRLADARAEGDLKENSDYYNAKAELEFLDGRIEELEYVVKNAEVVSGSGSGVSIGTKVTVVVSGAEHHFEIVGEWEADPMKKKISHTSPLGQALVGKKIGEEAHVEAPAGKIIYKIVAID